MYRAERSRLSGWRCGIQTHAVLCRRRFETPRKYHPLVKEGRKRWGGGGNHNFSPPPPSPSSGTRPHVILHTRAHTICWISRVYYIVVVMAAAATVVLSAAVYGRRALYTGIQRAGGDGDEGPVCCAPCGRQRKRAAQYKQVGGGVF